MALLDIFKTSKPEVKSGTSIGKVKSYSIDAILTILAGGAKITNPVAFFEGWQYVAINAIAEAVSNVTLKIGTRKQDGTVEYNYNAPELEVFSKTDGLTSKHDFFYMITVYSLLTGDFFILRDGKQLNVLPADAVKVKGNSQELVTEYEYNTGKTKVSYSPKDVIWGRRFNPEDIRDGKSPLIAFDKSIRTWDELESYVYNLLKKGGQPSGVLTTERDLGKTAILKLKKKWADAHGGVDKVGNISVLAKGMKYEKIGHSPADLQAQAKSDSLRDTILALYKVPKVIVGLTDGVNYASAKVAEYIFAKYVVLPELQRIVDAFNVQYFTNGKMLAFDSPVPDDAELIEKLRLMRMKYKTIDEIRAEVGLPPLPNGEGNKLASNVASIIDTQTTNDGSSGKSLKKKVRKSLLETITKDELKAKLDKKQSKIETYYVRTIRAYFSDLKQRVLSNLSSMKGYSRKAFDNVIDSGAEGSILGELLRLLGLKAVKDGNKFIERLVNQAIEIQPERFNELINEVSAKMALEITDTTKSALLADIIEGMKAGESLQDIKDRVSNYFDEITDARAYTIARTEGNRWANLGQFEATKKVSKDKEWITIRDDRARHSHVEADGQVVPVDAPFVVNGEELLYPSAPNASAENSINCRCQAVPKITAI